MPTQLTKTFTLPPEKHRLIKPPKSSVRFDRGSLDDTCKAAMRLSVYNDNAPYIISPTAYGYSLSPEGTYPLPMQYYRVVGYTVECYEYT